MLKIKTSVLSALFLTTLLLTACNRNEIYNEYRQVDNMVWKKNNRFKFEVVVENPGEVYSLTVAMRHNSNVALGNMSLELLQKSPSGQLEHHPFVFNFRDKETGRLLGEAMMDICDTEQIVIEKLRLAESGVYIFELAHTMEDDNIPSIIDVGIKIKITDAQ
jgi:gliding motility-associated lipoprotein GldH